MRLKASHIVVVTCVAVLLSGCFSRKPVDAPTKPNLIPYTAKEKRDAGDPNALSSGENELMQAPPTTANVDGELACNADRVWNDGKPFDGLRVMVLGNAFSKGLLGAPNHCHVEVRTKEHVDQLGATAGAEFKQTEPNVYTAIVPYVHCTDSVAFGWSAPALKAGRADYRVSIAPLDGSCHPITFVHSCNVDAPLNIKSAPGVIPPG